MTISTLNIKTQDAPAINSGLTNQARTTLAKDIGKRLGDSYVLMVKTQAVHWNIAGPLFKSVHDLTEDHYTDLSEAIDTLAERMRALGLQAPMNFQAMQASASIDSFSDTALTSGEMITHLANDHEAIAQSFAVTAKSAAEIGDPATEDLMVERLQKHETAAWMLRAMLAS